MKNSPDKPARIRAAPTIKDVAKAAGVSIATVSAVLNGTARVSAKRSKLVRDAVATLGYAPHGPARSLRLGRTKAIGVIVGDIANPFFTSIIHTVEQKASEQGYFVIVANTDDDREKELHLLNLFREQRVAGIILAPTGGDEGEDEYAARIRRTLDMPIVLVDRALPDTPFDTVLVDNAKAAYMATDYLARLGHRRIGIISGEQNLWTMKQRFAGYRDALDMHGIESDADLICTADSRTESAYRMTQKLLLMRDPPSAIFAANNLMMLGTIEAIIDMGFRCPEDVSVAGIDDLPWSSAIRPRLTTIAQPLEQLGTHAIEMLLERIEAQEGKAPAAPRVKILEPEFLVRESCAPFERDDRDSGLSRRGKSLSRP